MYYNKKQENKIKAYKHHNYMIENYNDDIQKSINNSKVYYLPDDNINFIYDANINNNVKIYIEPLTTEKVVKDYINIGDLCVLNFASFKYPGGGFINGAIAQEECLCHSSNLYNIIGSDKFKKYYEDNRRNLNDGLYSSFIIYSPNVDFVFNDYKKICKVNVITCAAPNAGIYLNRYNNISKLNSVLESRIKNILETAKLHKQKNLILGAFGCGVFKNDPDVVANIFKKYIYSSEYQFENIIFAIPPGNNYNIFKRIFTN